MTVFFALTKLSIAVVVLWCSMNMLAGRLELPESPAAAQVSGDLDLTDYQTIEAMNLIYQKSIDPIFRKKCFVCHGQSNQSSWYSKLPVVRGIVDLSLKNSMSKLDMTVGFPFPGRESIFVQLVNLGRVVKRKRMPPLWWTIFKGESRLKKQESRMILNWVMLGVNGAKPKN